MNHFNNIQEWETSVVDYLEELNKKLQVSDEAKNLYFGFEVIDGKLIDNPKILFIGINPGSGNKEKHYTIKFSTERISYLDSFDEEYSYPLAKETSKLFKLAGLSEAEIIDLFENSVVKTNLYHIATKSEKEIKKCLNFSEESFGKYYNKSTFYCIGLIKLLAPKIVIFEGKLAYQEIIEGCFEIKGSWDKDEEAGYYFDEKLNIHFIGYSRTYSNINSIDNVAERLKKFL